VYVPPPIGATGCVLITVLLGGTIDVVGPWPVDEVVGPIVVDPFPAGCGWFEPVDV
jgi:hypothetical protein